MSITDKLPPHDSIAEAGIIGCLLLDPPYSLPLAQEKIRSPEFFYEVLHGELFKIIGGLVADRNPVDLLTVFSAAKKAGIFHDREGLVKLSAMMESVPSAANVSAYAETVAELYLLRRVLRVAADASHAAMNTPQGDVEKMLDGFESAALSIRRETETGRGVADVTELIRRNVDDYERAMAHGAIPGITTGLYDLDKISGGLQGQQIICLAGTPSAGKTSMALNVAERAALELQIGVGIFSLETSAKKIVHRMTCQIGQVNSTAMTNGNPQQRDMERLAFAQGKLNAARERILICDRGGMNIVALMAMGRQMFQRGARLFIVDYLQLIAGPERTDTERLTAISKGLKNMAKEFDVPVLVVSSLSRDSSKENRAPKMSDLRGSGQIEFDADQIWLLHCEDPDAENRVVDLHVAKNKDGQTGKIKLSFQKSFYKFRSMSCVETD